MDKFRIIGLPSGFDLPKMLINLCLLYAFVFGPSVLEPDLDLCIAESQQLGQLRSMKADERTREIIQTIYLSLAKYPSVGRVSAIVLRCR